MPRISRFSGMTIAMYYNDHLPAHFHALYAGQEALIVIETLALYAGQLPRRAFTLALEWAARHRAELLTNWEQARQGLPLDSPEGPAPIDGLA